MPLRYLPDRRPDRAPTGLAARNCLADRLRRSGATTEAFYPLFIPILDQALDITCLS